MTLYFWPVSHYELVFYFLPTYRGRPQGGAPAQISSSGRRRLPPRTHTLEHSTLLLLLLHHPHSRWFSPAPPTLWHHRIPPLSLNACTVRYLKLGCSKLGYTTTIMITTQWSSTGQVWKGFGADMELEDSWTGEPKEWECEKGECVDAWPTDRSITTPMPLNYVILTIFLCVYVCQVIKLAQETIGKGLEDCTRGLSAANVCILFVENLSHAPI